MSTVLIIDDDALMRDALALYVKRLGHAVVEAGTLAEGRALQASEDPDITIVDYYLPDGTAFDLIDSARERGTSDAIIVLTGLGSIDLAVRAIKAGAEQFLTKPVDPESLGILVRRTLESRRDRRQRALSAVSAQDGANPFLGSSRKIREIREMAEAVLDSEAPVLVLGETGTGKGVLARWLHAQSPRRNEPFVDLNCAGLSRELVESELFGHRRGAFTGAVGNKPGLLEVADGGSLFLDEVGDLELAVQPKLLKVLEEGTFRRVGDISSRSANIRLIAATHKNLGAMVQAQKFREDLLFRINTLVFELPPLRERAEDLSEFVQVLLVELARRKGRVTPSLSPDALELLGRYRWPGNIRELRNVLERALLFAKGDVLDRTTLRFDRSLDPEEKDAWALTLDEAERRHIVGVLRGARGQVEEAAQVLSLSRSALYAKLKKHGIKVAES
ncbi:MAG TPA: sigma-54 dependent transcriptional regulator [Polyangiaceae bacterium]|nr:sigma-54 dependent transcriptional regulator [Polyangiaceae bacterium]